MQESEALIILNNVPLLGPIKSRQLIDACGSPENALKASSEQILALPGFGEKLADSLLKWEEHPRWATDLELVKRHKTHIISYADPRYPRQLRTLNDRPLLLYLQGDPDILGKPGLAIVGTRSPTIYGTEMARTFASSLAARGFIIVSGLARGIDTAAHVAALETGKTIAVIGSGLANVYPRENVPLAQRIAAGGGAVISEFPMGTPPDRQKFPQRNRIVSGMTQGTLLIEAPASSGAMITMNKGFAQKRALFAIPGRADIPNFRGNHALIKEGKARLVENSDDLCAVFENLFAPPLPSAEKTQPIKLKRALSEEEAGLVKAMPASEVTVEELLRLTQLPVSKLSALLMSLVLKKTLKEYPGKIYRRVN